MRVREIGDEATYNLIECEGLARKKGLSMISIGEPPLSKGIIKGFSPGYVYVSGGGYLGLRRVPIGALT